MHLVDFAERHGLPRQARQPLPERNDGIAATSPLLWDGQVLHTPGMYSEDDAGANLYYEPDALCSTVGLLDTNVSQHTVYEYDAFGNVANISGTYPVRHPLEEGFGGGIGYQEEYGTGSLVRCGNRYYNPYFGRFLTQDPSGDGENWYAYCANNPTINSDPSGLAPQGASKSDDTPPLQTTSETPQQLLARIKRENPGSVVTVTTTLGSAGHTIYHYLISHPAEVAGLAISIGAGAAAIHYGRNADKSSAASLRLARQERSAKIAKDMKAAKAPRPKSMGDSAKAARLKAATEQQSRGEEESSGKVYDITPEDEDRAMYQQERIQEEQDASNAGRGSGFRGVPTNNDPDGE